jgi:hypothetical protein
MLRLRLRLVVVAKYGLSLINQRGKRELHIWHKGLWVDMGPKLGVGDCRTCKEIGDKDSHRKQDPEKTFGHEYKRSRKGYLFETVQVDSNNDKVDVYNISFGAWNIWDLGRGPTDEVHARELKARQA